MGHRVSGCRGGGGGLMRHGILESGNLTIYCNTQVLPYNLQAVACSCPLGGLKVLEYKKLNKVCKICKCPFFPFIIKIRVRRGNNI